MLLPKVCRVFAANRPITVLMLLFFGFTGAWGGAGLLPHTVSFIDAADAIRCALRVDLESLPSAGPVRPAPHAHHCIAIMLLCAKRRICCLFIMSGTWTGLPSTWLLPPLHSYSLFASSRCAASVTLVDGHAGRWIAIPRTPEHMGSGDGWAMFCAGTPALGKARLNDPGHFLTGRRSLRTVLHHRPAAARQT